MSNSSCSIYTLFLSSIVSTLLGVATLVLVIIFQYIGFISSALSLSLCSQSYIANKYLSLVIRLQTSFVCVCISLLMNFIALVLISIILKSFRNYNNQQNEHNPENKQQTLSHLILTKSKMGLLYIFISLGTLGNIVCFGSYLSFITQIKKYESSCLFGYNETNLLILVIVSGVWLFSFILIQYLVIRLCVYCRKDNEKQQIRNKYVEMINVTQQGQDLDNSSKQKDQKKEFLSKQNQFVNQYAQSKRFDKRQNDNRMRKEQKNEKEEQGKQVDRNNKESRRYVVEGQKREYQVNIQGQRRGRVWQNENKEYKKNQSQQSPKKESYKQYRQRQTNEYNQPNQHYQRGQNSNVNKTPIQIIKDKIKQSPNSQNQGKFDSRFSKFQQSPSQQKTFNSNYANNGQRKQMVRKANDNQVSPNKNSRNNTFNNEQEDQGTKGQLFFYKRGMQQSNRNQTFGNENSVINNEIKLINNQGMRNQKFSSGEVSFKSPSRFDSKFAEEEQKYLNNNTYNSILPANSKFTQKSPQSRNKVFEQGSSYNQNNRHNRYQESSPSQSRSRTKVREGVLTSFIRGKFN